MWSRTVVRHAVRPGQQAARLTPRISHVTTLTPTAQHRRCPYPSSLRRAYSSASISDRRSSRFSRFRIESERVEDLQTRNPLNYIENERLSGRRSAYRKRLAGYAALAVAAGAVVQTFIVTLWPAPTKGKDDKKPLPLGSKVQRLDAPPGSGMSDAQPVRVVQTKPGDASIKVDEQGHELVETGTSTIPHFPRTIKIPSSSAAPSAQSVSSEPGKSTDRGLEEYQLLGLGIRTVSFLRIQVYVLGLYVRVSDLDALQAAFVKHVNPLGSSLIPSEKASLKANLLSADESMEIWNKVLRESGVRSAVRIVPTRGTDFAHLRDGWVRGITARTQELSRANDGKSEFDEPGFGESMGLFKQLMGGKGKAPKGSVVLLTRDEKGTLGLLFEDEKTSRGATAIDGIGSSMGTVDDERISRQVWLGYLAGKNVSSEGARKSIVDGVIELVERPLGTLGTQIT